MKNINLFPHSKEKPKKQEEKKNLVFFIAPTRLPLFFYLKTNLHEKPESLTERTNASLLLTHYTMKAYIEYRGNRWCIIEDENQKSNLFKEGDKLNQIVVGVIMPRS